MSKESNTLSRAKNRAVAARAAMIHFAITLAGAARKNGMFEIRANDDLTLPSGLTTKEKPYYQRFKSKRRKNRVY